MAVPQGRLFGRQWNGRPRPGCRPCASCRPVAFMWWLLTAGLVGGWGGSGTDVAGACPEEHVLGRPRRKCLESVCRGREGQHRPTEFS